MVLKQFRQTESVESYMAHSLYHQAMQDMQKGEWEAGLKKLDDLMQVFPLEQELRALRQEMLVRSRIDQDEREDRSERIYRRYWKFSIRFAIMVALLAAGIFVFRLYSNRIQEQYTLTRQALDTEIRGVTQAAKFRDAQDYLRAGQTDAALTLLNEIAAEDPNFPDLATLIEQAKRQQALETQYAQAMELIKQDNISDAIPILQDIERQEPYFRDVKNQIQNLEQQTTLGQMLTKADSAFQGNKWEEAAAGYEELYLFNPEFQTALVEDRLFTSYVKAAETKLFASDSMEAFQAAEKYYRKALALRPQDSSTKDRQEQVRAMVEERMYLGYIEAAQAVLAENPNSLEALNQANSYFNEALKLRPNDAEIALQNDLALKFLQAQGYFKQGNYNGIIDSLEYVYSVDKGYAAGTARQTLYEAYVARADGLMAIGNFETALEDYQRAAVLAEEDPGSKLRLYEVQLKLAEAMGAMGDYQPAVQLYSAAVELAGLRERAQKFSQPMQAALAAAERYTTQRDYKNAWRNYRDAVTYGTETFELVEHIVESDDYLSSLALEYGSTVGLIAVINNLANPNIIIPGQKLLIPILP